MYRVDVQDAASVTRLHARQSKAAGVESTGQIDGDRRWESNHMRTMMAQVLRITGLGLTTSTSPRFPPHPSRSDRGRPDQVAAISLTSTSSTYFGRHFAVRVQFA